MDERASKAAKAQGRRVSKACVQIRECGGSKRLHDPPAALRYFHSGA